MTNTGKAELSDNIAKQALEYLKANTVFAQLVARDWDNEVAQCGKTVDIRFPGALTANDKVANVGVKLQPSLTRHVTLNKHEESFIIEDIGRAVARPDVLSGCIEDRIKIIAEAIDSDIAALYSRLSQTVDATTGLGVDGLRKASMKLREARALNSDRSFVFSEDAEHELLGIEKFVRRDYQSLGSGPQTGLDGARAGSFMGFRCYMNQNVTYSENWKNLAFHKNAFVLVSRPLPPAPPNAGVFQSVMNENGIGLRVTVSDNPAPQVTIDVLYGVAEKIDNFGVVVTTAVLRRNNTAKKRHNTSDGSKPGYYIVNPGGAVHECTKEHAAMRLRQVSWRMATGAEIEKWKQVQQAPES